jgi:hypothetical protein
MESSLGAGVKGGGVEQCPVGASLKNTIAERAGDDKKINTGGRPAGTKIPLSPPFAKGDVRGI